MPKRIAILVAAVGVGPACAAPTMVYGQRPGQIESGYVFGSGIAAAIADDFVLGADTSLLSAEFWAFAAGGGTLPDTITLALWADEGSGNGVDDGGLIYEQTFAQSELDPTADLGAIRFTAEFGSSISLDAGTVYWLSIGFKDDCLDYAWVIQGLASPDPLGTSQLDFDENYDGWDGPFDAQPGGGLAFSLTGEQEGQAIPLPTASVLAGVGIASVVGRRRRATV